MMQWIRSINRFLWILIAATLILIGVRMVNPVFLSDYSELNEGPATIAALLFVIVLMPGTLQRMGINWQVVRWGVAWRRTMGIAMYLAALLHFLFLVDYLPWFSGGLVKNFDVITASGFVAVILLLPVLLMSNNASVRFFKRYWKILQRMTYLALPLIGIHVWQAGEEGLAFVYGIASILIIISYFMKNRSSAASLLMTGTITILVILLAVGISYTTLKLLFKNPEDAVRDQDLKEQRARVETLQLEKLEIEKELKSLEGKYDENKKKLEVFEAEAAEAARQAEEARLAEEAKKAEEERLAALSDYADGTYSANASYVTDGGDVTESMDVTLTIAQDTVTGVTVAGHLKKNKSVKYFGKFESAIGGAIIGKDIDSLSVHGIGGASDTSTGFRTALAKIKAQATR